VSHYTLGSVDAVTDPGRLNALRAVLLDLDGVVYTGSTPLPGAAGFFAYLGQSGRRFQCITNNSTLSAEQYAAKLGGMGIEVLPDQVLTSSEATALCLQARFAPGARVLAIGEEGLVRALLGHGFRLVDRDPDVVVCGLDRRLTYERLTRACFAVRGGAPLIATNPDLSLPTEGGLFPGNGATLAYLRAATGVTPEVIGKPEATMLQVAMERIGATAAETAIVGDGLLTDILAGQRAGVTTILVLTGVSRRVDLAGTAAPPDHVFEHLPQLQEAMRGAERAARRDPQRGAPTAAGGR
jgi:4-nitrophenyl phosphatase